MGLFDSAEERARKKKLKEEEKERKRKEFEKIMASNPEVSTSISSKPQSRKETKEKEKLQRAAEMERLRNAGRTVPPSEQRSQQSNNSNVVKCPKCGSTSITANKKGFSLAKGAAGIVAVGALGVVAAGHGKNKVIATCLKCGHQWKPGK